MSVFYLLLPALVGFVLNVIITPVIIRTAHRHHWYDERNHRKIHTEDTPRIGGLGIFVGFLVAAIVAAFAWPRVGGSLPMPLGTSARGFEILLYLTPILGGTIIVHVMGLVDDFRNLRARTKFLIHLLAAIVVTLGPFRIERLTVPFIWYHLELGVFSYPVTILWIAGVSNALNFLDGVDGLAGGTAAIASIFFVVIALLSGAGLVAMIALAILGSVLAFLVYNAPPARIFMGDSGAYSLGFLLAVFPLMLASGTGNSLDLLPAFTVVAVPIADMLTSMARRLSRGKHPFSADREHLHHKLMDAGLGTRRILLALYLASIVLGLAAVAWYLLPVNWNTIPLLATWTAGTIILARLTSQHRRRGQTG
jgi:UDP-GlcNAc:undecaprenyl-phosphate GlcNAc-1-phosphate transferase